MNWKWRIVPAGFTVLLIVLAFVFNGIAETFRKATPATYWMDVHSVFVNDAPVGQSPLMEVDRDIHREFDAEWIAEIERLNDGGFGAFCTGRGENIYSPDNSLPPDLNLEWWLEKKCHLSAGRYRVTTRWLIKSADKRIRVTSNVFEVSG